MASAVTFPLVYLAERLGWSGFGMLASPLNSGAWAACVYLALSMVARLGRRGARDG